MTRLRKDEHKTSRKSEDDDHPDDRRNEPRPVAAGPDGRGRLRRSQRCLRHRRDDDGRVACAALHAWHPCRGHRARWCGKHLLTRLCCRRGAADPAEASSHGRLVTSRAHGQELCPALLAEPRRGTRSVPRAHSGKRADAPLQPLWLRSLGAIRIDCSIRRQSEGPRGRTVLPGEAKVSSSGQDGSFPRSEARYLVPWRESPSARTPAMAVQRRCKGRSARWHRRLLGVDESGAQPRKTGHRKRTQRVGSTLGRQATVDRLRVVDQLHGCNEAQLGEVARLAERMRSARGRSWPARDASAGSSSSFSPGRSR